MLCLYRSALSPAQLKCCFVPLPESVLQKIANALAIPTST